MSFGDIGIPTINDLNYKKHKKRKTKKKKKRRSKSRKNNRMGSDIGIPTMSDMQPTVRKATAKERRKARKNAPRGSRVIGIDQSDNSFIMSMGDVGDPLETNSMKNSMLNSDISKVDMSTEFDYNLGDTGFGLKQKDFNKDKKLDKKPLTQLTFKTPFGDISRTEIPISDEKGNPMKNKKGIVQAETVTEFSNVNPAFSLIGKGLSGLNSKIQTQIQKEKDKRETERLIEKAVKAQKPNRLEEEEYCVQVEDRTTGNIDKICYKDKELAERAISRARSEGLSARKV